MHRLVLAFVTVAMLAATFLGVGLADQATVPPRAGLMARQMVYRHQPVRSVEPSMPLIPPRLRVIR